MDILFDVNKKIKSADKAALEKCKKHFEKIDEITNYNQQKVLKAFIDGGVSESHFAGSTGYGYGDRGREVIENVFADIMGAEASLFRHNFCSGTHTLAVMLFGLLRPNDTLLCVTGRPYDTLIGVLGIDEHVDGSLKDFGVNYEQAELLKNGEPDFEEITKRVAETNPKVTYIQRSRGYSLRPSLTIEKISKIVKAIRKADKNTIIAVDNCYGEFVEKEEPLAVGADIIAGSLIKNPGGGIAPTGGYIAGKKNLVEKCAFRLTAPGVGGEIGATLGHSRELFMGLFSAPHVTGEALKTAVYAAALFETLGFEAVPSADEKRADIIESLKLGNAERLIAFCQGMQKGAPVDSFVTPEPWDMPGYDNQVIMAAGAFTLGASIELSADAPLREPYAAWLQGALNFHSGRAGVLIACQFMAEKGLL